MQYPAAPRDDAPPPKRRRPGSDAEAQLSFGGDTFKNTLDPWDTQTTWRVAIEAALAYGREVR